MIRPSAEDSSEHVPTDTKSRIRFYHEHGPRRLKLAHHFRSKRSTRDDPPQVRRDWERPRESMRERSPSDGRERYNSQCSGSRHRKSPCISMAMLSSIVAARDRESRQNHRGKLLTLLILRVSSCLARSIFYRTDGIKLFPDLGDRSGPDERTTPVCGSFRSSVTTHSLQP